MTAIGNTVKLYCSCRDLASVTKSTGIKCSARGEAALVHCLRRGTAMSQKKTTMGVKTKSKQSMLVFAMNSRNDS